MKKLTILAAAAVLFAASAIPAAAADWNFYGSSRISTFVTETDNPTGTDTSVFGEALHANARIGAKVKVSDTLAGRFEYGASKGNANLRQLYGEWNFGTGKLLVGQTYTPLCWFYSKQAYNDKLMLSYGAVYGKRVPMLRLRFGDLKIAAISPSTDSLGVSNAVVETTIPRIEASYKLSMDKLAVEMGGGYSSYSLLDPSSGYENDVRSYILALGATLKLDRWYLKSSAWFGQNTGPYGMSNATDTDPVLNAAGNSVVDNDAVGFVAAAGVVLNDTFAVEAGYGYTEAELDQSDSHADALASYYFQTTVTLAPGVFFVPEIGVIDNKTSNTGVDQSEILYYGIKWQINF